MCLVGVCRGSEREKMIDHNSVLTVSLPEDPVYGTTFEVRTKENPIMVEQTMVLKGETSGLCPLEGRVDFLQKE